MFSIRRVSLTLLAALVAWGCGGTPCQDTDEASCLSPPTEDEPILEEEEELPQPPLPRALRLEVESGAFVVGEEVRLAAFFDMDDGSVVPLTEGVRFESSREDVAAVDETGLVEVVAGGEVVLRAIAEHEHLEEPLSAELDAHPTCVYPEYDGKLGQGKTMPPLAWSAMSPEGEPIDFRLEDVHCQADWKWVKSIHFVFSAGWCGPCTDYAREMTRRAAALRERGMLVVIVELETRTHGEAADTSFAYGHVDAITTPVPGIIAGDLDTRLDGSSGGGARFLKRSGFVTVFPTRSVVRTRDMRFIADASETGRWAGKPLPLEQIASDPEKPWFPFDPF